MHGFEFELTLIQIVGLSNTGIALVSSGMIN